MEKINFQNGVTPVNANTFNTFQNNINETSYIYKITSSITAGTEVTIPCYYKVGKGTLDVYLNGERLLLSSDSSGTNGHYQEVGTADSILVGAPLLTLLIDITDIGYDFICLDKTPSSS